MKFGPIAVGEAEGAILAHSEEAAESGSGRSYKIPKGTWLTARHVADLAAGGLSEVVVARLSPGDVHEDEAAHRLSTALLAANPRLSLSEASTGRVNLRAEGPGVVELDSAAIHAVNRVDPGITVATVPEWRKLGDRGLAATIKIIPYAVPGDALDRACDLARGALRLHAPRLSTATLVETQVGSGRMPDKGRRAMAGRLEHFGVTLSDRVIVPHETDALRAALEAAPGDLLMVLTGSATSDMRDTAPEALRAAGGAAWVRHRHMTNSQGVATVMLTLGQGAANWKDFALLVRDGEVIDTLTCWQCDTRLPDFAGADLEGLTDAGRPVDPLHRSFSSRAAFDAALAEAQANPGSWIDRTVQFGQSGTQDAPFWVLNTWERVHR